MLLAASDFGMLHTASLSWQARGRAQPRTWRVLSASGAAAIVLRDGASSLELCAPEGATVLGDHGMLWRMSPPFRAGERFAVRGMAADVLAAEGRPTRVRYAFERASSSRIPAYASGAASFETSAPASPRQLPYARSTRHP